MVYINDVLNEDVVLIEQSSLIHLEDFIPISIETMIKDRKSRNEFVRQVPGLKEYYFNRSIKANRLGRESLTKLDLFRLKELLAFLIFYPKYNNLVNEPKLEEWIKEHEIKSNFDLDYFLKEECYEFSFKFTQL